MNEYYEKTSKNLQKKPLLGLGKNICPFCKMEFVVVEYELIMPGTKEREEIYCPHCNSYIGDVFINGIAKSLKTDK